MTSKVLADMTVRCVAIRTRKIGHVFWHGDNLGEDDSSCGAYIRDDGLGRWGNTSENPWVDWTPISADIAHHPLFQAVAIGKWGQALLDGKGDFHEEVIRPQDGPVSRQGEMRRVRCIGEHPYAVGMSRQVYRRDDAHVWKPVDTGCLFKTPTKLPTGMSRVDALRSLLVGFNSIDGFSETDMYAVGLKGEIWHSNGKTWQQLDSPTNLGLHDVVCTDTGVVYACGDDGVLLRGRDDAWSVITDPGFPRELRNLAWFAGRLWLAAEHGLYVLADDGSVQPVDWGDDEPDTTYHLCARDGIMWSVGAKDIMQYDGKTWTRID